MHLKGEPLLMMYTDHGLQVHLRIPVRVINNDHVGCSQVNPQPTSPSAQHEEKLAAVGLIKGIDGDLRRLGEKHDDTKSFIRTLTLHLYLGNFQEPDLNAEAARC